MINRNNNVTTALPVIGPRCPGSESRKGVIPEKGEARSRGFRGVRSGHRGERAHSEPRPAGNEGWRLGRKRCRM